MLIESTFWLTGWVLTLFRWSTTGFPSVPVTPVATSVVPFRGLLLGDQHIVPGHQTSLELVCMIGWILEGWDYLNWPFSIAMLNYQRVHQPYGQRLHLYPHVAGKPGAVDFSCFFFQLWHAINLHLLRDFPACHVWHRFSFVFYSWCSILYHLAEIDWFLHLGSKCWYRYFIS